MSAPPGGKPFANAGASDRRERNLKVIIIGAGVIGCAAAHYLAGKGVAATVIDKCDVAAAASGKSGGFLARDWCGGQPQDALAGLSYELHQDLARTLPADYGYRTVETFATSVAARPSPRQSADPPLRGWLGERCRGLQQLGDHASTAQLHPARFTHALLDSAAAKGATFRKGSLEGLVRNGGGRVTGALVDGEELIADYTVIAMGPWSILAAQWLPMPAVFGLKGYSITLRPARELPAETLFLDYQDAEGAHHQPELVPRAEGEVYLCGFGDESAVPLSPADVSVDERACDELRRVAGLVCDDLRDAPVLARQACYRPICQDAMPLIGELHDHPGVVIATGHNCWGMLNAPGTGLAVAELIAEGNVRAIDLAPFSPARLAAVHVRS